VKSEIEKQNLVHEAIKNSKYSEELKTLIAGSFSEFANTVVSELNMDTYQETLIGNRLAKIVQIDMQRLMRETAADPNQNKFSPVTLALMSSANEIMISRLSEVYGVDDVNKMKHDLSNAQSINMTSLEALGGTPEGLVNKYGTSNPLMNAFKRTMGVLAARVDGGANTPEGISNYIFKTLNKDDPFYQIVKGTDIGGFFERVKDSSRTLFKTPPIYFQKDDSSRSKSAFNMAWSTVVKSGSIGEDSTKILKSDGWKDSGMKVFSQWVRPDLYWTPNWWSGSRMFQDDEHGSMATQRAFFCMQTLATPDPRFFNDFCKGSILYSRFETPEVVERRKGSSVQLSFSPSNSGEMLNDGQAKLVGLSLIYDDWYSAYERNYNYYSRNGNFKKKNVFQGQRICAVYDHFRANQVYFLTETQKKMREAMKSH
jgi:hypothetical protein